MEIILEKPNNYGGKNPLFKVLDFIITEEENRK